jgi:hypothetical protein
MNALTVRRDEGLNLNAVAFEFPGVELLLVEHRSVNEECEASTIANTCGKRSNTLVDRTSAALVGMGDSSVSVTGARDDVATRKLQLLVSLRFSAIASNVNPEVR